MPRHFIPSSTEPWEGGAGTLSGSQITALAQRGRSEIPTKWPRCKLHDTGLCAAGLGPWTGFPSVRASSLTRASPVLPSPSASSAEPGWNSWQPPAAPRSWETCPPPGRAGPRGPSRHWLRPAWRCHRKREPRCHGNLKSEWHGEGTAERELQEMWVFSPPPAPMITGCSNFIFIYLFIYLFIFGCEACGIFIPQLGIEPRPLAMKAQVRPAPGNSLSLLLY